THCSIINVTSTSYFILPYSVSNNVARGNMASKCFLIHSDSATSPSQVLMVRPGSRPLLTTLSTFSANRSSSSGSRSGESVSKQYSANTSKKQAVDTRIPMSL